ncbi:hypothetical protein KI387_023370, partial [Taxus chinensis]
MDWGYLPKVSTAMEGKIFKGPIITTKFPFPESSGYNTIIQTPSLHPSLFSIIVPWISTLDMKKRMSRFSKRAHILPLARDKGSSTVRSPGHIKYTLNIHDGKNLHKGIEKVLRILVAVGEEEIGMHHYNGEHLKVDDSSLGKFFYFSGDHLAISKETGQRLGMGVNMYPSSTLLGVEKDGSIETLPVDELIEKVDGFAGVFP